MKLLTRVKRLWTKPKQYKLMLIGLDAVGKSTLMVHLCGDASRLKVKFEYIGLTTETIETPHLQLMSFDWVGMPHLRYIAIKCMHYV
jgi:GTPase SAR1 family protein